MEAGMDPEQADARGRLVRQLTHGAALGVFAAGALWAGQANATEGGASLYLLGSGGPEAAIPPPLVGVYADNMVYVYDASAAAGKQFEVGGNVVANLHATIVADFATVVWVPTTNFAGGTVVVGGALPFGDPNVDVSAVLTGPLGRHVGVSLSDSAFIVGDPIGTASESWKFGDVYVQGAAILNIPIGQYRDGQLANLAFHRWAGDTSMAVTWHDPKVGWDVSGKAGFTFNGTNPATQYTSGTEFHIEGSIEKTLSKAWAIGAQAYYFNQVTGDSGPGAKLGPFEGRIGGVGGTAAYSFAIGHTPMILRGRIMTEFDAVNRLSGTSYWLDLSFPLAMKMPAGAPHE
jgi:hypothetical protein